MTRVAIGTTYCKAPCRVCYTLSPATIHTVDTVLTKVVIACEEHNGYLANETSFIQVSGMVKHSKGEEE